MEEDLKIVNKVADSGLISIDLEEFYPEGERVLFDLKGLLYEELILKEKDFREHIKKTDWLFYKDKFVAVTCSVDAVIPTWAYMLVTTQLEPYARKIVFGDLKTLESVIFSEILSRLETEIYRDKRIVIKGCSNKPVPEAAYVELTRILRPVAKSIMYGEPCSTVPVYKQGSPK